jgi:hypothetical protein
MESNIEGMFKTNTGLVKQTIDEVKPESWFRKPGDDSNHLMWVLGHLLWSRSNVLKNLNEHVEIPSPKLFARGAQAASPDEYPSVD